MGKREWFLKKAKVQKITVTVYKVAGETNTDDLSPAPDAGAALTFLCALAMLKIGREGILPTRKGPLAH